MSIYKDIIYWATNKPLFIQDAIRRMLVNPNLTTSDIDELLLLLKKEVLVKYIDIIICVLEGIYSSGLCNAVFTLNDISMHVSISNRDKIAYITELFDRYPLLLQPQTINTTSHD